MHYYVSMRHGISFTKKQLINLVLVLLFTTAAYFMSQNGNSLGDTASKIAQSQPGLYRVTEVVDGDTIRVNMNGHPETVRFIGIDTPETHHPNKAVQCFGQAAADYTKRVLGASTVRLESDPLNTNRDRYDRLLRYVYLPDGTLVNAKIIEDGYGFSYTSFPFSKTDQFNLLEQQARQANRGLWGDCQVTTVNNGSEQTNPAN